MMNRRTIPLTGKFLPIVRIYLALTGIVGACFLLMQVAVEIQLLGAVSPAIP